MYNIRTVGNYKPEKGEVNGKESMTSPDQVLSIKQIHSRHLRSQSLPWKDGTYDNLSVDDEIIHFDKMDNMDKHDYRLAYEKQVKAINKLIDAKKLKKQEEKETEFQRLQKLEQETKALATTAQ